MSFSLGVFDVSLSLFIECVFARTSCHEGTGIDNQGSQPGCLNLGSGDELGVASLFYI